MSVVTPGRIGSGSYCFISGVHSVAYAFPKVRLVTTAVDPKVNEKFHILPGIGKDVLICNWFHLCKQYIKRACPWLVNNPAHLMPY